MFILRKSNERGLSRLSWLKSWHTFSFDSYHDPSHMSFKSLRVINEDIIDAKSGFGTHPHKDMEILTYVLRGALRHEDSLGNGSVIKPGELQRMSAGTGIMHSEYNDSDDKPVHLMQIWLMPNSRDILPSYEQKSIDIEYGAGLKLIASEQGSPDAVQINQDVLLFAGKFKAGEKQYYKLNAQRALWLQVLEGRLQANDNEMSAGDGAAISEVNSLNIISLANVHMLLFDMAA